MQKAVYAPGVRAQFPGRRDERKATHLPVVHFFFPVPSYCVRHALIPNLLADAFRVSLLARLLAAVLPSRLPTQELAGEEGFEPPLSVLETDGLPLNLLP